MKSVLVTGGKGQLANCIKNVTGNEHMHNFIYVGIDELDITDINAVKTFFEKRKITHCINCAAYTAVDKAESDKETAEKVNIIGAMNLAQACKENKAVLIHISTDFVFDGAQTIPYKEENKVHPLSTYGLTKYKGEQAIVSTLKEHIIIRTSWLYSEYGHNFLKTMLRLGNEKDSLNVVSDQIGSPTYAGDLAKVIIDIINLDTPNFGTYHYSNEGVASWYDFAKAIFDISGIKIDILPIKTEDFPTPAIRPKYSVLDKSKIKSTFNLVLPYWRESLRDCIKRLKGI